MGIKKHKPITSTRRWQTTSDFSELTTSAPYKPLTRAKRKSGGRNVYGRITVSRQGGGHRQRYRIIDFCRDKRDMPAKVVSIEYDPNRSSRIALLEYEDGERRYIIAPMGLRTGDKIASGVNAEIAPGNSLPLAKIPPGTPVHNIELVPGRGGQIARSAGNSAQIMSKEGRFAHVRLPSGEVRIIDLGCFATVGQVGNPEHSALSLGKAGRSRHRGRRPRSRGVAMNPVDHPLGGGEGKSSGGRHPTTPWGKPARGFRTRKKGKASDKYIIKRRK